LTILLTGGSANGKSTFAENLLEKMPEPRYYIATMQPFGDSADSKIARHVAMRAGKGFISCDVYRDVDKYELPQDASVLLECMCNLTANEMFDNTGNPVDDFRALEDKLTHEITSLASKCRNLIIVTNEVGAECHEYKDLSLTYAEILGNVNARLAAMSDRVYELAAGIPILLK